MLDRRKARFNKPDKYLTVTLLATNKRGAPKFQYLNRVYRCIS